MTCPIIPETGFLRLDQIIGSKKKGIAPLLPIGKTTWYVGVMKGEFPAPVKLGGKISLWRAEDIRALFLSMGSK